MDEKKEYVYLEGYIEDRIAGGDRRTYGYPPSVIPPLRVDSMELESSIVVALRTTPPINRD